MFSTASDGQEAARIRVFQGENEDIRHNTPVGEFMIEGLADVRAGNQIVVRLDLDLDGILRVTATERTPGLAQSVTIDNAMARFRQRYRTNAVDRLEEMFQGASEYSEAGPGLPSPVPSTSSVSPAHQPELDLISKAERVLPEANEEDASELSALIADLRSAIERDHSKAISTISSEIGDLVFYLEDS